MHPTRALSTASLLAITLALGGTLNAACSNAADDAQSQVTDLVNAEESDAGEETDASAPDADLVADGGDETDAGSGEDPDAEAGDEDAGPPSGSSSDGGTNGTTSGNASSSSSSSSGGSSGGLRGSGEEGAGDGPSSASKGAGAAEGDEPPQSAESVCTMTHRPHAPLGFAGVAIGLAALATLRRRR